MVEFINGLCIFLIYLIPFAIIMFLIRKFTKIPDELFRKILHFILLGAYIPLLFSFNTWWKCIILVGSLIILLLPILKFAGKIPGFSSFVNERKKGEFTSSMVLALSIMLLTISIGWGIFDDKFLVLASVYAWGVGDAFAALIGKRFGKHKINWKFVDNKKSYEGSIAMIITSAISVFVVLLVRGGVNPIYALLIALIASTASTFVELCSKNCIDTITCPSVAMSIIVPLLMLLGA